jgi:hypothetical protein
VLGQAIVKGRVQKPLLRVLRQAIVKGRTEKPLLRVLAELDSNRRKVPCFALDRTHSAIVSILEVLGRVMVEGYIRRGLYCAAELEYSLCENISWSFKGDAPREDRGKRGVAVGFEMRFR